MGPTEPEVLYCYRCGKRVKREPGRCWYCDAPNRRGPVRPHRHCPFCHEVIAHEAVKCPHCREFLDGRPSAGAGAHQQITINVDKAVFQDGRPVAGTITDLGPGGGGAGPAFGRLSGGAALPDPDRTIMLPGGTAGFQGRLPGARQRALPGPARRGRGEGGGGGGLVPYEGEAQEVDATGALIPVRENLPQRGPMPLARRDDRALAPAAPGGAYALQSVPAAPAAEEEESLYAVCPVCQTEIFATDNYCFHCGTLRRRPTRKEVRQRLHALEPRGLSNGLHYALSIAMMGGAIFESRKQLDISVATLTIRPTVAVIGLCVVAFLLLTDAFLRRHSWGSRLLTLSFFVLWVLMLGAVLVVQGP